MLSGTPEVRGMTAAERREIRQLALEVAMAAREQERDSQEMKREEELVRKRREKIAENAAAALKWRKEWGPAQHGDAEFESANSDPGRMATLLRSYPPPAFSSGSGSLSELDVLRAELAAARSAAAASGYVVPVGGRSRSPAGFGAEFAEVEPFPIPGVVIVDSGPEDKPAGRPGPGRGRASSAGADAGARKPGRPQGSTNKAPGEGAQRPGRGSPGRGGGRGGRGRAGAGVPDDGGEMCPQCTPESRVIFPHALRSRPGCPCCDGDCHLCGDGVVDGDEGEERRAEEEAESAAAERLRRGNERADEIRAEEERERWLRRERDEERRILRQVEAESRAEWEAQREEQARVHHARMVEADDQLRILQREMRVRDEAGEEAESAVLARLQDAEGRSAELFQAQEEQDARYRDNLRRAEVASEVQAGKERQRLLWQEAAQRKAEEERAEESRAEASAGSRHGHALLAESERAQSLRMEVSEMKLEQRTMELQAKEELMKMKEEERKREDISRKEEKARIEAAEKRGREAAGGRGAERRSSSAGSGGSPGESRTPSGRGGEEGAEGSAVSMLSPAQLKEAFAAGLSEEEVEVLAQIFVKQPPRMKDPELGGTETKAAAAAAPPCPQL